MARVEISETVTRSATLPGRGLVPGSGISVQVNVRGGGAATVYQAATGGTTRSNPLTTDSSGRIEGYVEEGSYDLVVSPGSLNGVAEYTQRFEAVSGASAVSVESGRVNVLNYAAVPDDSSGATQTANTAAIQAAIDALPARGGRLVVPGRFYHDGKLNWDDRVAIIIEGEGGVSGGAETASQLIYTGTGTGFSFRSTVGIKVDGALWFRFTNGSHSGVLMDFGHSATGGDTADADFSAAMIGSGTPTIQGTGILVSLDKAINCDFNGTGFKGGNVGVRGKVASGGGNYSNGHHLERARFAWMKTMPVRNLHQGCSLKGARFQQLYNGSTPAGAGAYEDESGYQNNALNLEDIWCGDADTTGTWVSASGDKWKVSGYIAGGAKGVVIGASSFGVTVDAKILGGGSGNMTTGVDVGANCQDLTLDIRTSNVTTDLVFADNAPGTIIRKNGRVEVRGTPAAKVTNSASQSTSSGGGANVLTWDTEAWDTGGLHDGTNPTRLTAPIAGLYMVSCWVDWASNTTGLRQVKIRANGTTTIANEHVDAGGTSPQQTVSVPVKLAAGEYVELIVAQTSGGALNVTGGATESFFAMHYVGSP